MATLGPFYIRNIIGAAWAIGFAVLAAAPAAKAQDVHFALPADPRGAASAGAEGLAQRAGADVGLEHVLVARFLAAAAKLDDRAARLRARWTVDPRAGAGNRPETTHRAMTRSFASGNLRTRLPFEDRTSNPQAPIVVSGNVALFYWVVNAAAGDVAAAVSVEGVRTNFSVMRTPADFKDEVAADWHYTGWLPFRFEFAERPETGRHDLFLDVAAGTGVDSGLVMWKDLRVTEAPPPPPVAQQPPGARGGRDGAQPGAAPGGDGRRAAAPEPRRPEITRTPQPRPPAAAAPPPAATPQSPFPQLPIPKQLEGWTPTPPVEKAPRPPVAPPAAAPPPAAPPPGAKQAAIPPPPPVAVPPPFVPIVAPPGAKPAPVLHIAPHDSGCMRGLGAALAWDHRYVDKSGRQPVHADLERILTDLRLFAASKEPWVSDGMKACARRMIAVLQAANLLPADRQRLLQDFADGYNRAWA